jgi:hypothetical protein
MVLWLGRIGLGWIGFDAEERERRKTRPNRKNRETVRRSGWCRTRSKGSIVRKGTRFENECMRKLRRSYGEYDGDGWLPQVLMLLMFVVRVFEGEVSEQPGVTCGKADGKGR